MRFRSVVRLGGKTATGIPVPEEVVEDLGRDKRPPVRVTINGHAYHSTVAPVAGEFMLPLSAENREGAGGVAGDEAANFACTEFYEVRPLDHWTIPVTFSVTPTRR